MTAEALEALEYLITRLKDLEASLESEKANSCSLTHELAREIELRAQDKELSIINQKFIDKLEREYLL